MTRRIILISLIAAITLAVPAGDRAQTNAPASVPTIFKLTGIVKSVDTKGRRLIVQQDNIPGFMAAMTMPYKVGQSENLKKFSPGDNIQADIVVADSDAHLENIKVNSKPAVRDKQK